jgi:hypothetical protein
MIKSSFISGAWLMLLFITLAVGACMAQTGGVMVAPDTAVTMAVERIKGEIFIELNFADGVHFTSAELERRPDFEGNFTRFGYVAFSDVTGHCGHVIKKDNYPYHDSADVFYRLKLVYDNGKVHIYPAIMLPAAIHGG